MRAATAFKRNTLGYGLTWPLRRIASSDFLAAEGESLIRSCIAQILGTRPGELPWRPDFGIDLEFYRNKNNNEALSQEISAAIVTALSDWEPRIEVSSCQTTIESTEIIGYPRNVLRVRVLWAVRTGASAEDNNVLIGPVSQEVVV